MMIMLLLMQLRYSILLGNVMSPLLKLNLVECMFMPSLLFSSSGAVHFMASNNDSGVRDYDMERFQLCKHFQFDWPVNHTSLSPDRKLVVIVGDDPNGLLIDANSGKVYY
jgi:hypothetical protein